MNFIVKMPLKKSNIFCRYNRVSIIDFTMHYGLLHNAAKNGKTKQVINAMKGCTTMPKPKKVIYHKPQRVSER